MRTTHDTLIVCRYRDEDTLVVVDVSSILSVVAMVPFPFVIDGQGEQYFLIEQAGLDVLEIDIVEDDE